MTDRVYPSAKPNGTSATTNPAAAAVGANHTASRQYPPQFPPTKGQLYNPSRHPYRPTPSNRARHNHRRCSCRRCFCLCCFWSILIICIILLLAAIVGAAFYVLYRPHRPTFSVSAVRISQFNLTTLPDGSSSLTSKLNITISAKNPNKKMIFSYDPMIISSFANQVLLANGSFSNFTSNPKDMTMMHSTLSQTSEVLDGDSVTSLNLDLKRKNGLPITIVLDTMVIVKMEKLKSKKIGIRVICEGIHGGIPKGKIPAVASSSDAKCKVDLRIKIWKWTF